MSVSLVAAAAADLMRLLDVLKMGMFLCDVPTPCMVLDHSTAQTWKGLTDVTASLNNAADDELLNDLIYLHTSVLSGRESCTAVGQTTLSGVAGVSERVVLARLDCGLDAAGGDGAYCGLGLNNHFTGGYYWGRASGPGAAMPAPGVELVADGATCQLVRVANSNDGKRSEWCEFLRRNDQLQIVPPTPQAILASSVHDVLVGVRRVGEGVPPGAEPIVDAMWQRLPDGGGWSRVELKS